MAKIALPKIRRLDKLRGVSSPAHRRLFPLAAWLLLCAWLCGLVAPSRVEAMTTTPAKIASWGAGVSASGRTGDPSTANQDGIRVGGLCAYESASGLPEWLSRDPLEEEGGLNLYAYVFNDPVGKTDRLGLGVDSVTQSLYQAMGRGSADAIESILEVAGDALPEDAQAAGRAAVNRLRSNAGDLISKECKGAINREFPSEMRDKTLEEIQDLAKQGNKVAQKAKKLLNDSRFKK